jgi:hypothetical protein
MVRAGGDNEKHPMRSPFEQERNDGIATPQIASKFLQFHRNLISGFRRPIQMVVYDEGLVLVGELFRLVPKNVFDPFIGMPFDGFDLKAVVGVQKNDIPIFDRIEGAQKPFSPFG